MAFDALTLSQTLAPTSENLTSMHDNRTMQIRNHFDPNEIQCVVMIDFDGVTHPDPYIKSKAFEFLPCIEEVLRQFNGLGLVISSDWRKHSSLELLTQKFSPDMQDLVLGATPDLTSVGSIRPAGLETYVREAECVMWMREANMPMTPWIAIDDRAIWFSEAFRSTRLVETDIKIGFTPDDSHHLSRMLSNWAEPAQTTDLRRMCS